MQLDTFKNLQEASVRERLDPDHLAARYELLPRDVNFSLRSGVPLKVRGFRLFRNLLVSLRFIAPKHLQFAWTPKLKHVPEYTGDVVVLIWAVGDFEKSALEARLLAIKETGFYEGVVPVLITDVPDFAFYSRLGWLVEYVPELSGVDSSYPEKKLNYLAWRYRNAKVISCDLEN